MSDIILPPSLRIARSRIRYVENTGVTRGAYNGVAQTTGHGGDRVAASIDFTFHGRNSTEGRSQHAQLLSFLMGLRGKQNRVYLSDSSYAGPRGSFPAPEIFANPEFNGTTGWTVSQGSITATDGVMRLFKNSASSPFLRQSPTLSLGVPYVVRSIDSAGGNSSGTSIGPYLNIGTDGIDGRTTTPGYKLVSAVASATSSHCYAQIWGASPAGITAGAYSSVLFSSLSRCFLVDGGGNSLLQSNTIDNVAWSSIGLGSVTANAATAPDDTVTAELLNQDTANSGHFRYQEFAMSSAAGDFAASCCFRASNRGWAYLLLGEQTGGTNAYAFVNLSTGALGTVTAAGNMENARAFVISKAGGWWELHLVARKTNAATVMQVRLGAATADNTLTYSGSAEGAIYVWRGCAFASGVPLRPITTTSAAVAAATQTGSAIYVKGLPVSTAGLLLARDWVEIDGQLKMVTAPLDSDAAGLGYLQFSPPLYRAVSSNTPIIVNKPMGRFILAGEAAWLNEPGYISNASLDLEEAYA